MNKLPRVRPTTAGLRPTTRSFCTKIMQLLIQLSTSKKLTSYPSIRLQIPHSLAYLQSTVKRDVNFSFAFLGFVPFTSSLEDCRNDLAELTKTKKILEYKVALEVCKIVKKWNVAMVWDLPSLLRSYDTPRQASCCLCFEPTRIIWANFSAKCYPH